MSFSEFLELLGAADLTKEQVVLMRKAGLQILSRVWLAVFTAWGLGFLGFLGLAGWVTATEVDRKIAMSLMPVSQQLAVLTASINTSSNAAKLQTMQTLRAAIVDAKAKYCRSPRSTTAAIYRKIADEAQGQFYVITGTYYAEPPCADL